MTTTPTKPRYERRSLRAELILFVVLGVFFVIVAMVYMYMAEFEPVGSTVFALLAGLSFLISGYLYLLSRRIHARPEDVLDGEIAEATGELGVFSPSSWWPLVAGGAAAFGFTAAAIGWWLMVPAAALAIIGVTGMVLEFSTGPHKH